MLRPVRPDNIAILIVMNKKTWWVFPQSLFKLRTWVHVQFFLWIWNFASIPDKIWNIWGQCVVPSYSGSRSSALEEKRHNISIARDIPKRQKSNSRLVVYLEDHRNGLIAILTSTAAWSRSFEAIRCSAPQVPMCDDEDCLRKRSSTRRSYS